jgi:hypothetical protein
MTIANTTIVVKKSGVSGNIPSTLANGELAINYADGKLYYKNALGTITAISSSGANSFATINASGTLVLASSNNDILTILGSNGITVSACSTSKTVTIGDGVTFNVANSKTQTYYQNTAPSAPNANDLWVANTGVMYENFGNTSYPVWAEVGPTGVLANTQPGILAGTTITASTANITYTPATTTGTGITISAANTGGGTGYADVLKFTNISGGATAPNKTIRLNSAGALEIIDSNYGNSIFQMLNNGDVTIKGNTTINGIGSVYSPNRPAFRVSGNGGSISATTTVAGGYFVVDYNQGGYLNTSTGYFTAPLAGLYQVDVVVRTYSNTNSGINQIIIRKTSGVTTTSQIMVEFGINTTMNQVGGATIVKLAAGDTLRFDVTSGTITFDSNGNWSVAYIG